MRTDRWIDPLAGVLAAGAALGTSEVLAGVSERVPSLVVGVAGLVVDEAPGDLVRWSIETFGSSQKGLLVTGIVLLTLVLGAVFGALGRQRRWVGVTAFVAFGLFGGWASARGALSSDVGAWVSATVSTGVGIASLLALRTNELRAVSRAMTLPSARSSSGSPMGPDRRRLLLVGSAAGAWAVFGGGVGYLLRASRNVDAARRRLASVLGARTGPLVPAGVEAFDAVPGVSALVTPSSRFYRIDTAIFVPQVDPDDWRLRVTGMVDRELDMSLDDLLALRREEAFITLSCVSNEVGGDLVGNALWSGIPLRDVLDRAGVQGGATQIVGRSVDGWTGGFPTEAAFDGRSSMIAVSMNGEPLSAEHGFPARLVVPGLYGYVSATKWLTEIELTTWEAFDGYWVPRGWTKKGPIKTQSRIDVPHDGSGLTAGPTVIAGVAWAPTLGISRVEVRIDEGAWAAARLSGVLSDEAWVQWVYEWDAAAGSHRIQVRATDGTGNTQTADIASPAPSGATGHHTITVKVT